MAWPFDDGYDAELELARLLEEDGAPGAGSKTSRLSPFHVPENRSRVDPCEMNDGATVPLGEDFPSGDLGPPYHPNCMCEIEVD